MYQSAQPTPTIEIPVAEWSEAKFVLYDERNGTVAYALVCDNCGRHVTVSPQEYEKFDATLCKACASKGV